ncbi:hypothetical protein AiwAL_12875 [Acidiphilium sp. AL]|uniref:Uncharacterized protein n=1 Tax=Acidiphilium iwatense TaxID=768198 RepID=A0ABS9DTR0_9PROT|nr:MULTISPECIES: hypothetical protein [Acidiphilium]MCF3946118.1 hypothetical protein [Acidiphilium iwatense]MCU4160988.1 hypothetical protein [Acidiphilium sp. AL]
MNRKRNRAPKFVLAAALAAIGLAATSSAAFADPPWAHDGWHGRGGWHHRWHRDDDNGWGWRGGYYAPPPVYYAPPPPPVYYAPPPAYYGPPSLAFGINIPLDGR